MKLSRREFIKTTSATTSGVVILPDVFAATLLPKVQSEPVCVFTKCLQFLDYNAVGETLAKAGADGAELAVRDGGQVLPANVAADLPKAVKALQKSGISVPMMVSGITSADDPLTEKVLGTAAELGIRYYRMGYLNYNKDLSIPANLDIHKKTIEKLEKVNRKFNIHGGYQNHSGTNVGGPVWDLYWLLKDSDPAYIGVQYDIRHAVAEGGVAWPLGMKLLAPWIKTTAIKDFYWKKEKARWILENVPLGEGMVDFNAYFTEYFRLGLKGPVSIHLEYELGGAESGKTNPTMGLDQILNYMKNDLVWFRKKRDEQELLAKPVKQRK
jgi:L-ribulose-5-phosphate 3-epimerase